MNETDDVMRRLRERVLSFLPMAWEYRREPYEAALDRLLRWQAAAATVARARKDADTLEYLAHKEPNLRNVQCACLWCTVGRRWITEAEADRAAILAELEGKP